MVEATVSLRKFFRAEKTLLSKCGTNLPATTKATESPFSQNRSCSRLLFLLEPSIDQEDIWALASV